MAKRTYPTISLPLPYSLKVVVTLFVMCGEWSIMNKHLKHLYSIESGLTLEGDLGEEIALWRLTSLSSMVKSEVQVAF